MDADFPACRSVIAEFMKALGSQDLAYLSPALYRHLSVCGRCCAGVLLLMHGLDPRLCRHGAGDSCEQCQADLAAFIEIELDNPAQAAATYPHVWRHLWACWICARTYEYTHTLLATERSGWLVPPRLVAAAQRSAPIIRRVRLTRQILALAIPRMGGTVTRGLDDDYVLFDALEEQPERRHLTIAAQEQTNCLWRMAVAAIPPPDGLLVLSSGAHLLVASFDTSGQASIGDIPADVLLDPDAPDIEVGIVPAEEPGRHFL
ncbi:MAG: hypothetical protein ACJ8CR_12845 [Roseiflexaceae bacterium]